MNPKKSPWKRNAKSILTKNPNNINSASKIKKVPQPSAHPKVAIRLVYNFLLIISSGVSASISSLEGRVVISVVFNFLCCKIIYKKHRFKCKKINVSQYFLFNFNANCFTARQIFKIDE